MVARRTADARSLAVITSYSSHSVQKSCCVMAASSSTIKTLGFILAQLLSCCGFIAKPIPRVQQTPALPLLPKETAKPHGFRGLANAQAPRGIGPTVLK